MSNTNKLEEMDTRFELQATTLRQVVNNLGVLILFAFSLWSIINYYLDLFLCFFQFIYSIFILLAQLDDRLHRAIRDRNRFSELANKLENELLELKPSPANALDTEFVLVNDDESTW
jgi:hypothetical protein